MAPRAALPLVLLLPLPLAAALDNGFPRPAMGFNPWNCFGVGRTGKYKLNVSWAHGFNDSVIRSVADAMAANGLGAAGYEYVNLDCGWTTGYRDATTGEQIVNTTRYPHGIKDLADYIHGKGLKFGIYSSASVAQCCSHFYANASDGSLDHEEVDARMYAGFGVDYLKFDGCGQEARSYPRMRDALNATGRHVVISVNGLQSIFGGDNFNKTAGEYANSWRTTPDDNDDLIGSLAPRIFMNDAHAAIAAPGQFNDPDMLEVGNMAALGNVTDARTHFSLWCIAKSPLIIGTDVTNITDDALEILTNKEAIAVNQDPLGVQGRVVWNSSASIPPPKKNLPAVPLQSVWAGPLAGGAFAAVLFNAAEETAHITLTRAMLDAAAAWAPGPGHDAAQSLTMRDVWVHEDIGAFDDEYTAEVASHDSYFITLKPASSS